MRALLVSVLFLAAGLAGCTSSEPPSEAEPFDPHAPVSGSQGGDAAAPNTPAGSQVADPGAPVESAKGNGSSELSAEDSTYAHPLLIELSKDTLESQAAMLKVPAGTYRAMRVILDDDMWSSDGDNSWDLRYGYHIEGADLNAEIVAMTGYGDRSWGGDDKTVHGSAYFSSFSGEGYSTSGSSATCSGCEGPPYDERVYLVGSESSNVTLRFGLLGPNENGGDLVEREDFPVRADLQTMNAWAGAASRSVFLASTYSGAYGIMNANFSDDPVPGVAVTGRTSHYTADAKVPERGVFAFSYYGSNTAGVDEWSYDWSAGSDSGSNSGISVHEPSIYGSVLTYAADVYPLYVTANTIVDPGAASFELAHKFTGVDNPVGLPYGSGETARIGYAGVDLEEAFNWEMQGAYDTARNSRQTCELQSTMPWAQLCF